MILLRHDWYKVYEEVFREFKRYFDVDYEILDLVGLSDGEIRREIRDLGSAPMIAIGWDVLDPVKNIGSAPIVYAYAHGAPEKLGGRKNITGVSMRIPLSFQIAALKEALPATDYVGLFYTDETRHMIRECREAAENVGVKLICMEIGEEEDAIDMLEEVRDKISAFWMLPNYSFWNKTSASHLFNYSRKYRIPVVTTSSRYMGYGALMLIRINPRRLGFLLAEVVREIVGGKSVKDVEPRDPDEFDVIISRVVARRYFLTISRETLRKAKRYDEFRLK